MGCFGKIVTVVVAIAVVVMLIVNATQRKRQRGELRVINLSEQYKEMKDDLSLALLDGHQQKNSGIRRRKETETGSKGSQGKSEAGRQYII